jgi:hypothetical protein
MRDHYTPSERLRSREKLERQSHDEPKLATAPQRTTHVGPGTVPGLFYAKSRQDVRGSTP